MSRTRRCLVMALCWLGAACAHQKTNTVAPDESTAGFDRTQAARVADELDQALTRNVVFCRTLSENSHVRGFFATREQPHRVLRVLRDVVTRSGAEGASLLDSAGVVIASTNPDAVGYDFSQWQFFNTVSEGRVLVFPAIGFVNTLRALYVVVPQAGDEGGAVVLRSRVESLDETLAPIRQPAALVFRDRYVLATNRPEFGFHGLRSVEQRVAVEAQDERQLLATLDEVIPPIGDTIAAEGRTYQVHRVPMLMGEWQLLVCVESRKDAP